MSTATPVPVPPKDIRRPMLWLLAILAVALGLRLYHSHLLRNPFELDEFTALAAVAERRGLEVGTTPTVDDALVPVSELGEVSNRSVIPFGVQDPVPLYHNALWAVTHVLPPADWSVRLPSLLAGLACVAAVFFLVRRPFGSEMALVAALFVALDPIQVHASWLARPFALANLFVVLSFTALAGLLRAGKPALLALAYAVCVAVIGYLNALLLLVIAAHLGMMVYVLRGETTGTARRSVGYWAAGLALGLLLLAPEFPYLYGVSAFALRHRDYLTAVHDVHLFTTLKTLLMHNLVLLGGLVLVLATGAVVRMQLQGGPEEKPEGEAVPGTVPPEGTPGAARTKGSPAAAPAVAPAAAEVAPPESAEPLPENDGALWMARLWVFLPQVALLVASLAVSSIFFTRYLTYTTVGGATLLAYYATRDGSREVRLFLAGLAALGLLVVGLFPKVSSGAGLFGDFKAQPLVGTPDGKSGIAGKDMAAVWKEGDVILVRAGIVESDFLCTEVPEAARPQVERVMVAPLTLLYSDSSRKQVIPLTLSQSHKGVRTAAGDKVDVQNYYDAKFAARLKPYRRFWMTGLAPDEAPNSWQYLACVVPWMATALERGDLLLARNRDVDTGEHYITVPPNLGPDESISGLIPKPGGTDPEGLNPKDFDRPFFIVKPKAENK
jgi:hypothetical protein